MRTRPALILLLAALLLGGCRQEPPDQPNPLAPPDNSQVPPRPGSTSQEPVQTGEPRELQEPQSKHRIINLNPDHPTYASVAELLADADTVLLGTITDRRTEAPSKRSEFPHWNYTVRVERVSRGQLRAGQKITVAVLGGESPRISWVLVGGPQLRPGGRYLFYLSPESGGKYYPLAGGKAVASENGSSYLLPNMVSASDQEPLRARSDGSPLS